MDLDIFEDKEDSKEPKIVVRITTNYFISSSQEICYSKKLRVLKRRSNPMGVGCFLEVMGECMDASLDMITNFHECDDGIYELVVHNEHRDWETGIVEDWDYQLIKIEEKNAT